MPQLREPSPITQNRKVERRPVESDELRRQGRNPIHEGCDQLFLGSFPDARCPESVYGPATAFFPVGNQRPYANDRVVDVLRELVAQFGSNLVMGLADVAVRGGKFMRYTVTCVLLRSLSNFTLCHRPRSSETATMAVIVLPRLPIGLSTMRSPHTLENACGMIGYSP